MSEYATTCDSNGFIDWMRDRAIEARWPERLIWQLDRLRSVEELEAEVCEIQDAMAAAEKARDDLYNDLEELVNALQIDREVNHFPIMEDALAATLVEDAPIKFRLDVAAKTLERHKL